MFSILVLCLAFSALSRAEPLVVPIAFGKLEQWLSEDLPKDGMGAFSPHIEMVQDQSGHSVRAKGVVAAGEIMARAPFTRCFSLYTAFCSQIGSVLYALYTHHGVGEAEILCLFLMHELLLQSESEFWPVIETWPAKPNSLIYFTHQELDELQNTQTAQVGREYTQLCEDSYRGLFDIIRMVFPTVFEPKRYSPTLWTKASVLVQSRGFNIEETMSLPTGMQNKTEPLPARPYQAGEEIEINMVLIPGLSLLNHAALYPYCNDHEDVEVFEFVKETKVYQLRNVIEIQHQEPVCWCYNEFENAHLLSDYGFALSLDQNPWEEVTIFIKGSALYYGLDDHLEHSEFRDAESIIIQARSLLHTKDTRQLVKKLSRVIGKPAKKTKCDAGAGNNHDHDDDDDDDDDVCGLSRTALAGRMLRDLLRNLPTTLAADETMLLDQAAVDALGPHGASVLTYRIAQKTLLHRTAAALEAADGEEEEEEEEEVVPLKTHLDDVFVHRNRNDYDLF